MGKLPFYEKKGWVDGKWKREDLEEGLGREEEWKQLQGGQFY